MSHDDPYALPGEADETNDPLVDDTAADMEGESDLVQTECWRCGKAYDALTPACPYCHARNKDAPRPHIDRPGQVATGDSRPVMIALGCYAIVLVVGIIWGGIVHLAVKDRDHVDLPLATSLAYKMLVVEIVDSVVIAVALVLCGRAAWRQESSTRGALASWLLAVPLLAAAIGINLAYHAAIIKITGMPRIEDEFLQYPQLLYLMIGLVCFQPAIVEELFMRQLFLGVLRKNMGVHGAVWVSATAFGMLHLGAPLSIPYLIFLGGILGYLRVASGTIVLPVLFHFAHNAVVVALEVAA